MYSTVHIPNVTCGMDGVGRTVWRSRGAGVSRTMLSVVVGKGLLFLVWSWYISAPKGLGLGLYRALLASEVAPEVRRTVPPTQYSLPLTFSASKKEKFITSLQKRVIKLIEFIILAYLGAYGTHMFALLVWVGDETSKTFFLVLSL